jgi:Flp pilus assembly protein TadD
MAAVRLILAVGTMFCAAAQDASIGIRGRIVVQDGGELPAPPAVTTTCSGQISGTWNEFYLSLPHSRDELGQCFVVVTLRGFRTARLPAHDGMTVTLKRLGDRDGSRVSLKTLSAPTAAKQAFQKGRAAMWRQLWKYAEVELRKAVTAYPEYGPAWDELGQALVEQGRAGEARSAWEKALKSDRDAIRPMLRLARQAAEAEEWKRVLEWTDRAMPLKPVEYPGVYYYRALALEAEGRKEEAVAALRMEVGMDEDAEYPRALFLLGMALKEQGEKEEAARILQRYETVAEDPVERRTAEKALRELKQ